MNQQRYRQKIIFWLRFSGWLCLLPAVACLRLYQVFRTSDLAFWFMAELILTIAFACYLLATAENKRWEKVTNLITLMIVAILLVPIIILIPLYFAYRACRRLNEGP